MVTHSGILAGRIPWTEDPGRLQSLGSSQRVTKCQTWLKWLRAQHNISMGFPGSVDDRESTCNVGDLGSIPGSGRSCGEGNSNPLQFSCLGNSMGRWAWLSIAQRVRHNRATNTNISMIFNPRHCILLIYVLSYSVMSESLWP